MRGKWEPYADLVVKNAKIYTVAVTIDDIKKGKTDFPVLENGAVAIKGDKIIDVCQSDEADKYIGEKTKVIDAGGKPLVPGFIDSHIHAVWTGMDMAKLNFAECKNIGQMQEMLAGRAASTEKGKWIEGQQWNHLAWDKPELPTRWDLDKVSPDHPVFFVRVCYHVAVANSKALELAGITKDTPNPEGGEIVRDKHGEPTGVLYENGAMGMIQELIPSPGTEDFIQAIDTIGQELIKNGITSIIDCNLSYTQMRAYGEARRRGKLHYRASLLFFLDGAVGNVEYHLKRLDESVAVTGFGDEMLKLNAVKVLLDGIPATGTAYMRRKYKHMPETNGFMTITEQELDKIIEKSNKMHWQVALHTVGNKAADVALESFRKTAETQDVTDRRHYLIHHPWPCDDQYELMRKMNIGIIVQPTIFHIHGESAILHEDMAHQNTPCKSYFDQGIILGGSSDNPIGNYNPFLNFYITVTRKDKKGDVWGKDQAITPEQALIMWTKNSAYFTHEEDVKGSVEIGNYADLVLLDRDFVSGDADDIRNTSVEKTILAGKVVYEK